MVALQSVWLSQGGWHSRLLTQVILRLSFFLSFCLANPRELSWSASSMLPSPPPPYPQRRKRTQRAGGSLSLPLTRTSQDLVHGCSWLQGGMGHMVSSRVTVVAGCKLWSSAAKRKKERKGPRGLSSLCHTGSVTLCVAVGSGGQHLVLSCRKGP